MSSTRSLRTNWPKAPARGRATRRTTRSLRLMKPKRAQAFPAKRRKREPNRARGGRAKRASPAYSPAEVLSQKDFSSIQADQIHQIRRLIAKLVPKFATRLSRRKKAAASAREIDLRRSVKRSIRTGGEVIKLFRRKRRIQKTQIILLCDVSGSMDSYSQFLIQFLYSLQNEIKSLRTFVFSTRPHRRDPLPSAQRRKRGLVAPLPRGS